MFGKSRTEKSTSEQSARANGAANGATSQKPVNRAEHGGVEGHPAAFAARLTEAEREELLAEKRRRSADENREKAARDAEEAKRREAEEAAQKDHPDDNGGHDDFPPRMKE